MQRRAVKTHDGPIYARVALLYPEQDYGFIETPGRLNVYFHRVVVEGDAPLPEVAGTLNHPQRSLAFTNPIWVAAP